MLAIELSQHDFEPQKATSDVRASYEFIVKKQGSGGGGTHAQIKVT